MQPRSRSRLWFNLPGAVVAYQPAGAPNPTAATINVAHNQAHPLRYRAVTSGAGVAPTWSPRTGWSFDGSSQWLRTNMVPNNGWSAIVRYTGASGNNCIFTNHDTPDGARFAINPTHSLGVIYQSGKYVAAAPALAAGILAFAGQQGYRNGLPDGSAIDPWTGTNSYVIDLASYDEGSLNYPCVIAAIAFYNRTLTPVEMWNVYLQIKYCDVNPDFSAWGRRRHYWIVPPEAAAVTVPIFDHHYRSRRL
jgi:hypothetical protein